MASEFSMYTNGEYSIGEVSNLSRNTVPNHVAIEGNVGSGKSTVAEIFAKTYKYPHIGEYGNYVNFAEGEKFPIFPPENEIAVIASNPLWMKLEFRRNRHMIDTQRNSPKRTLLAERSPLSLVSFEYAKMRQGFNFELSNLLGNYAMFLDNGMLKEPDGYVFLNTDPKTVQERIIQRGGRAIGFLFNPDTCVQIEHFFKFFKANYLSENQFIDIQTDDITPVEISTKIKQFMDTQQPRQDQPFRKFCNDVLCGNLELNSI